ncbi:MAG: bifunctional riboflavin kinase/FAD synthetase [Flavobacteriaceae bacterium]|nr:bifunctional riboflavin kinase/FAD synthetase [Flavobacteriaceae bacterium]
MEIIRDLSRYKSSQFMVISLGMFDGVHCGHNAIINALNKVSEEKNYASGIFSFWPHPRKILNPEFQLQLLTNLEEKKNILAKKNIDFLFLQKFNDDFKNLEAEEFVKKILVDKLKMKYILVGHDHRFGKNQKGDFALLKKMGKELDFEVQQLEAINLGQENISSTKIRKALLEGNILKANKMLGYHYSISGRVIDGNKIGRTIGYPTANISVEEGKLLPKKGAYIVEVWLKNKLYKGMLSIGTNPTVGGEKLSVEVYILDFNEDIYGEPLTLKFRDFLHEEIKFESLEKLIERLDEDKKLTEKFQF